MNLSQDPETVAARRYTIMNLVRIVAIAAAALGIGIARDAFPGPYPLGVVLAVAGVAGFFFGPYILVKRWKVRDNQG